MFFLYEPKQTENQQVFPVKSKEHAVPHSGFPQDSGQIKPHKQIHRDILSMLLKLKKTK